MSDQEISLNIESQIVSTKHKRRNSRGEADLYGRELLEQVMPEFDRLKDKLGKEDLLVQEVAYELSSEVLQCGIDFFKTIQDEEGDLSAKSISLLFDAKEITFDPQIHERIDDNLEGIADWKKNKAVRDRLRKTYDFHHIQLKTAFSFMTCDGAIAKNELALIKKMASESPVFGDIDIDKELDILIKAINHKGDGFLKDYLKVVKGANLSEGKELELLGTAIKTLNADGIVDYFEVKFFRLFRTLLKVSDQSILDRFPELHDQFLERDIFNDSYLGIFFDNLSLPVFDRLDPIDGSEYVDPDYQF